MANRTLTWIFLRQREQRIKFLGRACDDLSTLGDLGRILYRATLAHQRRKLALAVGGRAMGEKKDEPTGPSSA